ncbi:MAG: hypothetical protein WC484_06515 [Candidatus Omnitrophota bacterium]
MVIADLHCGHQVGLTPPGFHAPINDPRQEKYAAVRQEVWNYFAVIVKQYSPIDVLVVNGDAIEGKGERSGSTELITAARDVQVQIAAEVIDFIGAKTVRLVHGTPAHVGREEDWETVLAVEIGAKIGSHEWYEIEGVIFDCKHKIGSSSIPHGRLTPLAREILWNRLWWARGQQPKARVLIRSHAHYYEHVDHDDCLGFITPALQGFGSKYGSRECSGTVDIGALIFDVCEGGIKWQVEKIHGETQRARAEVF